MAVATSRIAFIKAPASIMAGVVVLLLNHAAVAQSVEPRFQVAPATEPQAPVTSPQAEPPQAEPPRAVSRPGVFGTVGRWLDESLAGVSSGWHSARDAVGGIGTQAGDVARGAAGIARDAATMVIPPTSLVSGRSLCVRAANGGPDCQAATDALCRTKGFTTGSSLHIQSARKCPVWGWINGDKPMGKCGTETYVTSAMCR